MFQDVKKGLKILSVIILFIGLLIIASKISFVEVSGVVHVDPVVSNTLAKPLLLGNAVGVEGEKKVAVIVKLREDAVLQGLEAEKKEIKNLQEEVLETLDLAEEDVLLESADLEVTHQYETINAFAGEITEKGLEKLKLNPQVESIVYDYPVELFLADSVPQIKADKFSEITVGGQKIDGSGEVICVIDTGIDYTHPSLSNCTSEQFLAGNCEKVIAGFDIADIDPDPLDTYGHGTHVAGIVASEDPIYPGVAPGAKLVAVKVFLTGSVSTNVSNVIGGIDWCIDHALIYNISIITFSLGDGIRHTTPCDDDILAFAANRGASYGLFVDSATGNNGYTNGLSSPACGSNVTSVGAVTKSDNVAGYSNSAAFLDLLAPGSSIKSLSISAGYSTKSGTSMAAPHVAGAAALLKQYWKLAFQEILSPAQITAKLKEKGKKILDERNGVESPRIDLFASLQPYSLKVLTPPENVYLGGGEYLFSVNLTNKTKLGKLEFHFSNGTNSFVVNPSPVYDEFNQFTSVWSSRLASSLYAEGHQEFKVVVSDQSFVYNQSKVVNFTVDTLPPEFHSLLMIPETVYRTNLVTFTLNVTDEHLNPLQIFLESDHEGNFHNYTMKAENGLFIYQLNASKSNKANITYQVFMADLANNLIFSEPNTFVILNNPPLNLTVLSPLNNTVQEIGKEVLFSAVAFDADQEQLNYTWLFADNSTLSGQEVQQVFTKSGDFTVKVIVSDKIAQLSGEVKVKITDTKPPQLIFVDYETRSHLEEDGVPEVDATAFDYSGIKEFQLSLGGNVYTGECQKELFRQNCHWSLTEATAGNRTFTLTVKDNSSAENSNSSNYNFVLFSCSDGLLTGDEEDVDCGGECNACAEEDEEEDEEENDAGSSSSSSSSGGGGSSSSGEESTEEVNEESEETIAEEESGEITTTELEEEISGETGEISGETGNLVGGTVAELGDSKSGFSLITGGFSTLVEGGKGLKWLILLGMAMTVISSLVIVVLVELKKKRIVFER